MDTPTLEDRLQRIEDAVTKLQNTPNGEGRDAVAREVLGKVLTAAGEIYTGAGEDRTKL